jgi:hypothetical protein
MTKNLYIWALCYLYKQIADLASLRAGMHKFEAYYIDNLVGKELYSTILGKLMPIFFFWVL